jgi:sugar phosphate isomerase/epimerase
MWLWSAAGALGASGLYAATGNFRHPIGVQLYTVRKVISGHEDEVLHRIAEIGYTEVELAGQNLDAVDPILKKHKLKPVSSHIDMGAVTGKFFSGQPQITLGQAIETAKKYGIQYLVFPYVMPDQRGSTEKYTKIADELNRAGEQVHAAGLTFCYHNHAFEFGGEPGQRAIDVFNAHLDKKLVNFEIDVFWVSVTGNDPVKILKEFEGRVPLVHLKDKTAGTGAQYNENVPAGTFKEVGSGSLDFPAILKTCETVGVKHYFVEQDETPGDAIDSLRKSYEYLRSIQV